MAYTKTVFPCAEQRTLDHQITAFKADRFHLDVYLDGETLVGFIGYWDFDDYLYIEHYAINSDLRGGGWGSRILEALAKNRRQNDYPRNRRSSG